MPGSIGSLLDPSAPSEAERPPPPAAPEGDAPSQPADFDAQIRDLEARLDSQRDVTLTNITPIASLDLVRKKARELRERVDRMRKRIYLPDPAPDSKVTAQLTELQTRWGDLVRPIADGVLPIPPVDPARWSEYAAAMSRLYCGAKTVPRNAPAGGMPLGGWRWACLSDVFFHELAEVEANVDRSLGEKRTEITMMLQQLMKAAEDGITTAASEIEVHPSPQLLLRELTWRLRQVELEGLRLRIRELEYQRSAGGGTAAFRRLLETSAKVNRPAGGSARTVSVFSGAKITVELGGGSAAVKVTESPLPRLARRLHDAHFRLEQLRLDGADPGGHERSVVATEPARVLTEMAIEARGDGVPTKRPVVPDRAEARDPRDTATTPDNPAADAETAPNAAGIPTLRFLATSERGFAPLRALGAGKTFLVEATFTEAPTEDALPVGLRDDQGVRQTVLVHRTDDPKGFRSGVVTVDSGN